MAGETITSNTIATIKETVTGTSSNTDVLRAIEENTKSPLKNTKNNCCINTITESI